MVFVGNILKQPAITEGNYQYRIIGDLKNTDKVMRDTFWLGVYPGLTEEMIDYSNNMYKKFCKIKVGDCINELLRFIKNSSRHKAEYTLYEQQK